MRIINEDHIQENKKIDCKFILVKTSIASVFQDAPSAFIIIKLNF